LPAKRPGHGANGNQAFQTLTDQQVDCLHIDMSTKTIAYLALCCTSIFWGISWVASREGVMYTPALQLAGLRQSIAGLIFVGFFLIKGEGLPTQKQMINYLIFAVLLFVLSNGLATWSVRYLPAGLGALIGAMYPLCVVLIEAAFFGKRQLSLLTLVGLFLGIAGMVVVFYDNIVGHAIPEGFLLGLFLAFVAVLSWSIGTIYIARANEKEVQDDNPYKAIGWQMFLGGIMLLAIAKVTNDFKPISEIHWISWRSVIYLVTGGSLITFVAFIYTMKHLPVAVASLYAYINPIVALLIGAWHFQEPLHAKVIIGSIITLVGVFIVNYSVKQLSKKAG
jgi:drug/metabolite transporter (DMT)-like permease